jgi:hypothetical protein
MSEGLSPLAPGWYRESRDTVLLPLVVYCRLSFVFIFHFVIYG